MYMYSAYYMNALCVVIVLLITNVVYAVGLS